MESLIASINSLVEAYARSLAVSAAERLARKERRMAEMLVGRLTRDAVVSAYAPHVNFTAASLGITRDAAESYCAAQIEFILENQTMSLDDFEDATRSRVERLMLKGRL